MKMINMHELNEIIKSDKLFYYDQNMKYKTFHKLTNHPNLCFLKAIIVARKYKFYKENSDIIINKIKMCYYGYLNNKNVFKYGLELYGKFGRNFKIYHSNVIINNNAILGDNVKLHGNNCIGNNGKSDDSPIIGNNVDIGYGAVIIGGIKIADNIKIGANALVTKDFIEEGITIVGIPAKKMK